MTEKQVAYTKLLDVCSIFIRNVLWQTRNKAFCAFVHFGNDLRMVDDVAQLIHSVPNRLMNPEVDDSDLWFLTTPARAFLTESDKKHYMYEPVRLLIEEINSATVSLTSPMTGMLEMK